MTTKKDTLRSNEETSKRHEREIEGGGGGAIAGAAVGSLAGPVGTAVGAVVGAVAGAIMGAAVENGEAAKAAEDRDLDEEIGVSEGELGAPNLKHPPAKVGAYSGGSAGTSSSSDDDDEPAEGPIQTPE
jgi:phage tail tape-measure protein